MSVFSATIVCVQLWTSFSTPLLQASYQWYVNSCIRCVFEASFLYLGYTWFFWQGCSAELAKEPETRSRLNCLPFAGSSWKWSASGCCLNLTGKLNAFGCLPLSETYFLLLAAKCLFSKIDPDSHRTYWTCVWRNQLFLWATIIYSQYSWRRCTSWSCSIFSYDKDYPWCPSPQDFLFVFSDSSAEVRFQAKTSLFLRNCQMNQYLPRFKASQSLRKCLRRKFFWAESTFA